MQQHIGFKLNESEYTIPILRVREIINTPQITVLPQSPHYMRGVINLRGSIVPIVDLRILVATGGGNGHGKKVSVVISGRVMFGVLVDEITSVVNIEESSIEVPDNIMSENAERVSGVARVGDRMLIMLDTTKLVDIEDLSMFEETVELSDTGTRDVVEVSRVVNTMGGQVTVKELCDVKEALNEKYGDDAQKGQFIGTVTELLDALTAGDLEVADKLIAELMQSADGDLYREIGKVTRKLHDSINDFKSRLDPRIKQIADEEVPSAVDNLQFVIEKTEAAANTTMGIVEKYLNCVPELKKNASKVKSPKAARTYFEDFGKGLGADMNEILVAQEYQDITGQTIKRVIGLINTIETELVGLIASFGVKVEGDDNQKAEKVKETMSQDDVEDLLSDFGF